MDYLHENALKRFFPWLRKQGIEPDEGKSALLQAYMNELCRWNEHMNLVGPASLDRIVRELVLDSLVAFPFLPGRGKLLDVGSGAGFPALPLKICGSQMEFLLVEPIQKRVNFLKHVIRTVGIAGISVVRGRIEATPGRLNPAGYDVVTTRAMAPFDRTIQLCGRHVARTGMLLTFHGEKPEKSFNKTAVQLKAEGLALERLIPYRLPGVTSLRHLAVLRKT
ncbi:MAG: 16S rRNA (guanine(527)-N(7))-methyltransferase RsmG [Desulfatiglandaceae bacterium]